MRSRFVCHAFALPVVLFLMLISCVQQQGDWEGSMAEEDGVTVVQNPLTPRSLGPLVVLREQFVLRESDKSPVLRGLPRLQDFAADSEGNLFLLTQPTDRHFVFKFDGSGRFLKSFIHRGQGPGELQAAHRIHINALNELTLHDPSRGMLLVFDTEGRFLEEISLTPDVRHINRLPGGRYLLSRSLSATREAGDQSLAVVLCDSRLNDIKELCRYTPADKDHRDGYIQGRIDTFYWAVDRDRIYVNTCGEAYEILVFDLDGALIRRIRKDFLPVPYPEHYKRSFRKAWKRFPRVRITFPQFLPPCHAFFTDMEGRLYVQTFEPGKVPGTWIHDIFDAEGVFIGRQSLEIAWRGGSLGLLTHALTQQGRLYCLQSQENGKFSLVVYLMLT